MCMLRRGRAEPQLQQMTKAKLARRQNEDEREQQKETCSPVQLSLNDRFALAIVCHKML